MIQDSGILFVLNAGLKLVKIILAMFTVELGKLGEKGKAIASFPMR
jgi:hypothetical protein